MGLGVLCLAAPIVPARAAEPAGETRRLEALEQKVETLERRHKEELEALREQIELLKRSANETSAANAAPIPSPTPAGEPARGEVSTTVESPAALANAFNPRVTVFGNFVGRADSDTVRNEDGDAVDNRFNLREVEVDFRAAIDPWADGVLIIALESEVPGEFDVGVEEGYATLKKLPILDSAPMGLKLTAGRFRPEFGRLNKVHTHELPWTTRPRSYQTFLGEEGYIESGLNAEVFIPTPGDNNALAAAAAVLNGGNLPVGEENRGEDLAYLGHLKWFWDLAPGHDFEIGSSVYSGNFDAGGDLDSRLYGLDLTYKWKPYKQGEWRSFILGGELFIADIDEADGGSATPLGYYLWSQYQLDRNAYFGVRYDFTEELDDDSLETDTYAAFLTYYTTEFLRLRLGYEHTKSDVAEMDGLDTGWLELNFVFGSHPVEPYWVNR
jgi:hypothetical protein